RRRNLANLHRPIIRFVFPARWLCVLACAGGGGVACRVRHVRVPTRGGGIHAPCSPHPRLPRRSRSCGTAPASPRPLPSPRARGCAAPRAARRCAHPRGGHPCPLHPTPPPPATLEELWDRACFAAPPPSPPLAGRRGREAPDEGRF